MSDENKQKKIYIVISQTGTFLSRILRIITKSDYNHASISLCDDLSIMYSFGRRNPYNPFWAGFVTESVDFGTFKRFPRTKTIVLSIDIPTTVYNAMLEKLEYMQISKDDYSYNYLGLCLAAFKIHRHKKNCYYCSEFVKDFLLNFDVKGAEQLGEIVHPMDFIDIYGSNEIYSGILKDFSTEVILAQTRG